MKIVIFSLILPVAILSFLPERAWAPPAMIEITGEISLISIDDGAVTGEPWMNSKASLWTGLNSPHCPDPDSSAEGGGGDRW